MKHISFDFVEGQIVELFHNRPQMAWTIYDVPDHVLRRAIAWNDKDGDFDNCDRVTMLEIFLHDFVVNRQKS
jgi:hypothetical protein